MLEFLWQMWEWIIHIIDIERLSIIVYRQEIHQLGCMNIQMIALKKEWSLPKLLH